jgi:hypothetical protein
MRNEKYKLGERRAIALGLLRSPLSAFLLSLFRRSHLGHAHQVPEYQCFQLFVVAVVNQLLLNLPIDGANLLDQVQENFSAVDQMGG